VDRDQLDGRQVTGFRCHLEHDQTLLPVFDLPHGAAVVVDAAVDGRDGAVGAGEGAALDVDRVDRMR
jgi:hypothetical protein